MAVVDGFKPIAGSFKQDDQLELLSSVLGMGVESLRQVVGIMTRKSPDIALMDMEDEFQMSSEISNLLEQHNVNEIMSIAIALGITS